MKKAIILLVFISQSLLAFPQLIQGRVVSGNSEPVVGATVVLQSADSLFVDAVITDDAGIFRFGSDMKEFRLIVQHMAFRTFEKQFANSAIGDIRLEAVDHSLSELVVSAERPLVRVEDGRLVYNLEQIVEGRVANNAYEALTKLPGVREENENLTLAGASTLSVIINGRPSTMTYEQVKVLLKSTPVERVEKVEVMYSAPPQYHVRGAALNIVLKKDTQYSLQGEVGATYRNRLGSEGAGHAFLRVATPVQAFDIMYSADMITEAQDVDMLSLHTLGGEVHRINQLQEIRGDGWKHNVRTSYEYSFGENSSASVAYTGQFVTDGQAKVFSSGNFQQSTNRKDVGKDAMHNISLQAYLGTGLSAGADYTHYENRAGQYMDVDFLNGNVVHMNQKSGQKINVYNLYADKSLALGNGWKLGYGAKYRRSESWDFQVYSAESTLVGSEIDSSLKEQTAEGYLSLNCQFPAGLTLSLSATAEYYRLNERERWTIYPQGSLTYMRNPNHIWQATLQVQKLYPSYWQLQDAVTYIDGYSEMHNSSQLQPSKTYTMNVNYIFRQKYVLGMFANYTDRMFAQAMYQCSDRLALIYKNHNWDYLSQAGFLAVLPYSPVQWFDTRATLVGVYIAQKCDDFYDIGFSNRRWVGVFTLDNSFRVSRELAFELNGFVQTPATQGTFSVDTMWKVSAGAKWNFAGGNGTLSCYYNDIFNSAIGDMKMNFKGQNLINRNDFHTRNFTLSLTYRFGGYQKKENKGIDTSRFGH